MTRNAQPINFIERYWEQIQNGKIKVSKKVYIQMQRLIKLLDDVNDETCKWDFDIKKGNRAISFIETWCVHVEGALAGRRMKLSLWQKAIVQALFGFVDRVTRFRKYNHLDLYVARKNGKTLLAACIMIYAMFKDGELGAKCYSAATKRDQAAISWEVAKLVIQKGPLKKYFDITINGIYVKPYRDSLWQPLSKDSKKLDGLNVHCALIDELHAIKDINMYDVIKDGMKARNQPILLITTTMGEITAGLFDDVYEEDSNILNGLIENERKLIFCYELDSKDECYDISALQKANPNLGISLSIEKFEDEIKIIKASPDKLPNWLRKTCNIKESSKSSWLSFEHINNEKVYDLKQFDNTVVLGGFDLSRTGDMTAFNIMYFDPVTKTDINETMYWITDDFLKESIKRDGPFEKWVNLGYVRVSGTNLINYRDITDYVMEKVSNNGLIFENILYDSYSAQYLIEELASYGFSKKSCLVPVIQGYRTLSVPMQTLHARLKDKKTTYQNNPVTKWCLSNVELVQDRNGNWMPIKGQGDRNRKIDGFSVILNCYVGLCDKMEYLLGGENG